MPRAAAHAPLHAHARHKLELAILAMAECFAVLVFRAQVQRAAEMRSNRRVRKVLEAGGTPGFWEQACRAKAARLSRRQAGREDKLERRPLALRHITS